MARIPELPDMEEGLHKITQAIGKTVALRPSAPTAPHEFVALSDKLAEALVQAAQEQLRKAESNLDDCKRMAEQLRAEMQQKSAELTEITARLNAFGDTVLTAHKAFHSPQPKESDHD